MSRFELPGARRQKPFAPLAILLVLAVWTALAQFFAFRAGYHSSLGPPAIAQASPTILLLGCAVLGLAIAAIRTFQRPLRELLLPGLVASATVHLAYAPLYSPYSLLDWNSRFGGGQDAAGLLLASLIRIGITLSLALGLASLIEAILLRQAKPDVHGSARWATPREIRRSGLLAAGDYGDGIVVGAWAPPGTAESPRYLRLTQDHNVLIVAPPRAGKGTRFVIPTLLTFQGSAFVFDVKSELHNKTAGARSQLLGQPILRLDLTSLEPETRFNPLSEVRLGKQEVRDASNISDMLVDPSGSSEVRNHWQSRAQTLLTGLILYAIYYAPRADKNLSGCARLLAPPGRGVMDTLKAMQACGHPVVVDAAQSILDAATEERDSIISTASSYLDLYRDPLVQQATEASDFCLTDLKSSLVTLYLTIPPSDLTRTRPFVRLFLSQLMRRLTEDLDHDHVRQAHKLLLMIDEFPTLGRLDALSTSLGFLAGYGILATLVCQDTSQILRAYGQNESITGQCRCRVYLTPAKAETATDISRMLGDTTIHHKHKSHRPGAALFSSGTTISETDLRRPLMTPAEAMQLPAEHAILIQAGQRPILTHRREYYQDPELDRRSRIPPPARADRLLVPSQEIPVPVQPRTPQAAGAAPLRHSNLPRIKR